MVGAAFALRGEVSLSSSSGGGTWWSGRRLVRSGSGAVGARRRWRDHLEGPFVGWFFILRVVLATPGCSIPAIRLPTDVATAECIATSEKASPRVAKVVVVLVRCGPASPSHCLALRWFRSHVGRWESTAGELEEWTGGSACGPSTLWRSEVAVPVVCAEGCFHIVLTSASSTGVVFGLTQFLLLWLVGDWLSLLSLVREAHPPPLFRICPLRTVSRPDAEYQNARQLQVNGYRGKNVKNSEKNVVGLCGTIALSVVFWLLPRRGLRLHVRRVSHAGRPTDVSYEKATTFSVVFRPRCALASVELEEQWYNAYRGYLFSWEPQVLCEPDTLVLGACPGVVLVDLHSFLGCSSGVAAGPFVRGYEIERENWTDDDKKKISLNSKAKSILCCTLSKKEFNRISACKSAMEMWKKLRITYEGTDKVKETRIDILVAQYERFQMQSGESITQMYNKFTDITNGLAGLKQIYEIGDMVRKILRSLPTSWTPKVTAIEEANDLRKMSFQKLIGSLMAHEINMERLGESSSKKKHNNALKAIEETTDGESEESLCSRSNFLRASVPFFPTILQKLSLFNSMAASGSSGSVGSYSIAFLTVDQQERFAAVRIKLCENKAVDIEDLEKNRMHSIVEAIERMKWMKMVTVSEPDYPDLAKAFYTCLKTEEDGSLSSTVKGTSIHITYDLLERLFGVSTVGHSGVDSIDIHAKGLSIIGTEYRLKDGKIDINQLNAFNRILHFIVIIERMKSATEMIWDKKNKLAVFLPYAHLLTRIYKDYEIDLKGEVMEKMGQPIRSINIKKSGFSLVGNVWTKTSVAEGEAIIGDAPEFPSVQEEEAVVRIEEPDAVARRIEEIAP
ncbi:hypothetical protein Taro_027394 [Colocasia esculenta]|uniref:Uncharacterized protein n=1 Tax=Colocasia esculenta TaxID=4460 RepID=A0A843VK07_COLES|nr:hypothetical protein [Colocasia esculenta]